MWLIVGLGNPGPKYELTRHNFGFLAIDALLGKLGAPASKMGFGGKVARFLLGQEVCIALKPETFMNKSGSSVQQAMSFHKIPLENVVVIHDELDLPLGEIRIKKGGGVSGHNGLKDIARLVGPDFMRIRLGIGRPNFKGTEADYVLSPFSDQELVAAEEILQKTCDAIKILVAEGLDAAQSQCQLRAQKKA